MPKHLGQATFSQTIYGPGRPVKKKDERWEFLDSKLLGFPNHTCKLW